ncbi:thiopurine S-methyltransferase, putative [Bodo saltans]|uniref:Thiopurine S-methyltransferase, putative n=1 Tax=Bodo saltans TaxID=75058 RepID=A0A0S4JLN2_BODSA|nr:thiopurine S-methyltransferase, putative [Bodo saltans]|eukprot:CUG91545.1 thiopurine S-methyltransferase, putative [Bodo saltans]
MALSSDHVPPPPAAGWKPQPDELQEDNMKSYWERAWNVQQTGWKAFEVSKPFHDNMSNVLRTLLHPAGDKRAVADDTDRASQAIRDAVKGKRVLVPLCGDTYALRYFADQGAASVVGVDLAITAIEQNAASNFPESDGFTVSRDVVDVCTTTPPATGGEADITSTTIITRFTITAVRPTLPEKMGEEQQAAPTTVITLLAGSLFDIPTELFGGPFDIVYDRAAMVALPPTLRSTYVRTLVSLAPRGGGGVDVPPVVVIGDDSSAAQAKKSMLVVLELVRRRRDPPDALLRGPPFDIPVEEVRQLYCCAAMRDDISVVVVEDSKATAFAAGTPVAGDSLDVLPPFRFCLYAIVV